MISQRARYAFKALIALAAAGHGATRQARDLAESRSIPQPFLEQILLDLKRAGILGSKRGREGGYMLLRDPEALTFGQILRLVDGPVAPLPCLSRTAYRRCEDCRDEETCGLRAVFGEAYEAQLAILERTSVAEAARRERVADGAAG